MKHKEPQFVIDWRQTEGEEHMTKDEVLKLALEALENVRQYDSENLYGLDDEITALRQAIEQAEKHEYSKRHNCPHCEREFACNHHEWVGVTGDEIDDIAAESGFGYINVARAIEAKLKEKNT